MSHKKAKPGKTLFDYFTVKQNTENLNPNNIKPEPKMDVEEDSDDEQVIKNTKKRSRFVFPTSDSESDDATTPKKKPKKKKQKKSSSDDESNKEDKPNKSVNISLLDFDKSSTTCTSRLKSETSTVSKTITEIAPKWIHEKLEFLKPEKIRDINKNKPSHPEYDKKTLYIPDDYFKTLTPAMKQWWELKCKHFDTVLFFKVGKFYELYHMDATVGVNHLGFSYMKGEFAHSGFPETAYGRMAATLIELGFKIARVEQTETPEMMAERCKGKKVTKFDKVVNREICQVSTKGTCVYGAQLTDAKQPMANYMLAISEKQKNDTLTYGICFIDVSIGIFCLSEFEDDKHNARLLTVIAQYPPALVLLEQGKLRNITLDNIKKATNNVRMEMLTPKTQFFDANATKKCLEESCYFTNKSGKKELPDLLQTILSKSEMYYNVLKALGACIWYLKDSELDIQVLSMSKFEMYVPLDTQNSKERKDMILDSVTIDNLKLVGGTGTLQKTLDYCQTAFGKRLLLQWICKPLCDVHHIESRQGAVKELYENSNMLRNARDLLKKLPDLERQIAKIHAFGNKFLVQNHPDGRAIMYESATYSKRKILDLISTLQAFENGQSITAIFESCENKLLKKLTQYGNNYMFLDLTKTLRYFKDAFDQKEAAKEGKIVPQCGIDEDYDNIIQEVKDINEELEEYLSEQRRFFGCQVNYFGNDKKRFQLEIPENKSHKVNSNYQIEGTKKGFKRYSTPRTKELLAKMMKAESTKADIIKDLNRRVFEKFSEKHKEWEQVTHCYTMLDVLCAFAEYARTYAEDICLPKLLDFSDNPILKIENARHPTIVNVENFVPNDTILGTKENSEILILTGPNMGGKSTLMRQSSLIIIMAQMGSYVPAASCEMTIVDRIFTRLGAHDDILKGQSTFLIELSEAAIILKHATRHSFVLIDELGRGTSTHDGNAIATAYVNKLIEVRCRTIFSTHYHSLVDHFVHAENIQLGYMSCIVENEGDINNEKVIFLYKLAAGVCPKSYGFNVAKLAGLPQEIINRAREISKNLETTTKSRQMIRELLASQNVLSSKTILKDLLN